MADALRSAGKFPDKRSCQLLRSSLSWSQGQFATGSWDPNLGPDGFTKVNAVLVELPKTVTKNSGSAACCSESQTHETVAGTKGKRFIQVLCDLGEW